VDLTTFGPRGAVITSVNRAPIGRADRPATTTGRTGVDDLTPPVTGPAPTWLPPGPTAVEVLTGTAAGIGTALAAPLVRSRVFGALGPLLSRPPARSSRPLGLVPDPNATRSRPRPAWPVDAPGDPGWFGPDSVAWKVHADTSIFVAGITAFALQALHPLALAGVVDHSAFAQDFMGRVRRTGEFVSGVVYGSSAEAAHRVAGVHRVHERVVGVAPDGRPYSANDPELLEWVHITEYLAIAVAFRRFGLRPLPLDELDRYIAEVAVVGEAMGVAQPPRSWAELDAAFQRFRPRLALGEQARLALRFLRTPPGLPAAAMPAWRTVWSGAVACLPPTTRRLVGLQNPGPAQLVACRSLVRGLGTLLGPPPPLRAAQRRLGLPG
jgi:uncharacterized protein (DUF2236 family)